nr:hypothetical protein [Hydrogenophaga electricum]
MERVGGGAVTGLVLARDRSQARQRPVHRLPAGRVAFAGARRDGGMAFAKHFPQQQQGGVVGRQPFRQPAQRAAAVLYAFGQLLCRRRQIGHVGGPGLPGVALVFAQGIDGYVPQDGGEPGRWHLELGWRRGEGAQIGFVHRAFGIRRMARNPWAMFSRWR